MTLGWAFGMGFRSTMDTTLCPLCKRCVLCDLFYFLGYFLFIHLRSNSIGISIIHFSKLFFGPGNHFGMRAADMHDGSIYIICKSGFGISAEKTKRFLVTEPVPQMFQMHGSSIITLCP